MQKIIEITRNGNKKRLGFWDVKKGSLNNIIKTKNITTNSFKNYFQKLKLFIYIEDYSYKSEKKLSNVFRIISFIKLIKL